jgi:hypothetical protein
MKVVSPFEANLLRILHFFLGRVPREQALPLLVGAVPQPKCLSAGAVELVQDGLAKGCTLLLARVGGWRRERHVRGEKVAEGRLWERTPPAELGLAFSRHVLELLIGVTAVKFPDERPWVSVPPPELTVGDWYLLYLAYQALRSEETAVPLRLAAAFADNALCRLAYPEDFAGLAPERVPDFAPWTTGLGACMLEALQPFLAERWLWIEREKAQVAPWDDLRARGRSQEQVLNGFLAAVEAAGRLDLARFLLKTLARVMTPHATPEMWGIRPQAGGGRMADRVETHQAALALVRQAGRFQRWERRARAVGYFDEGYEASQLTKTDWEHYGGDELHARAQAVLHAVDPLRVQTEGQP